MDIVDTLNAVNSVESGVFEAKNNSDDLRLIK